MGSIDLSLKPKQRQRQSVTPKTLLGANLLFIPTEELYAECRRMLGDNPFFPLTPPASFRHRSDIYDLDPDLYRTNPTLEEHLCPQIATSPLAESKELLSDTLFWCSLLDSRGYLNTSIADIASMLGISEGSAAECIDTLRGYVEPAGLFATDLRESLITQLERAGECGSDAWLLISNGAEYIESGKIIEFAVSMGWSEERVSAAMNALRALDPAPGKNFDMSRAVFPEVEFVVTDGSVRVRIVQENIPHISFMSDGMPDAASWMRDERWRAQIWEPARRVLIRLGMRFRTLIKISDRIAAAQEEYIRKYAGRMSFAEAINPYAREGLTDRGENYNRAEHDDRSGKCTSRSDAKSQLNYETAVGSDGRARGSLKPLTYSDVGCALHLSTSTVFRMAKNTYCRLGGMTVPMSLFFSRSLSAKSEMSVNELKSIIKMMNIDGCNDRMIAEELSLPVRTVSYHRKKLGLTPASQVRFKHSAKSHTPA